MTIVHSFSISALTDIVVVFLTRHWAILHVSKCSLTQIPIDSVYVEGKVTENNKLVVCVYKLVVELISLIIIILLFQLCLQGTLCGKCIDGTGVSVLLNICNHCDSANITLVPMLGMLPYKSTVLII